MTEQLPFNINITGNESKGKNDSTVKQDVYENYIIKSNQQLKIENDSLKKNQEELTKRIDELEDEVEKEEKTRIYMKGLMHNLVDMKNKTTTISDKNSENSKSFYEYNTKMNKQVFSKISPQQLTLLVNYVNYFPVYILSLPILSYLTGFIDFYSVMIICIYQLLPITTYYSFVDSDKKNQLFDSSEFNKIETSYKNNSVIIFELKKDVDKTQESCTCIDKYIDEI